ncbi:MAG TPA: chalcone isomerase family protein [Casimicrobiaceae bacterium]|nr:chalcone isomerase family protein [Casimicrobiaceae bacterium]
MNRTVKMAAGALFAMLVGSFAAVALAAEVGGVKLDDKVSIGAQELVLNGAGVRTRVVFKVYVASLYLPQKAADLAGVVAKSPRRIQLNLLRTLSADQLVDALNDGLAENNTAGELAAVKPQVEALATIMKSFKEVKEKDVITLDFVDGATRIGLNGDAKGNIGGEAFNQALTKVWLGDKPVQVDLKKSLLGV